jgi:hypothetical protein
MMQVTHYRWESNKEGVTVMLPGVPQGVLFVKLFHLSITHHLFSYAFISQLYCVVKVCSFQHQIIAVFFEKCLFHEKLSQHLA